MLQTDAYFTIVIYNRTTFIAQTTGMNPGFNYHIKRGDLVPKRLNPVTVTPPDFQATSSGQFCTSVFVHTYLERLGVILLLKE
jgi:hypothetical protein